MHFSKFCIFIVRHEGVFQLFTKELLITSHILQSGELRPSSQLDPHVEVVARLLDRDGILADGGQDLLSQGLAAVRDAEPQVAAVQRRRGPEGELVVAVVEVRGLELGRLAAACDGRLRPGQGLVHRVHADLSRGEIIAGGEGEVEVVSAAGHGCVLLCRGGGRERDREGDEGGDGEETHGERFVMFLVGLIGARSSRCE